jgi:hypothetical protein
VKTLVFRHLETPPQPTIPEALPPAQFAEWCKRRTCPKSTVTTALRETDNEIVLFVSGCKRWDCEICGPKKRSKLIAKILQSKPRRFLTLTIQAPAPTNDRTWTPREAFDQTRRQCSELFKAMNRGRQKTEYCRILEQTKNGYPHYHYLTRGPFWPVEEIRQHWKRLTGAYIVDVRRPENTEGTIGYVAKYLTKADSVDFTGRRFATSRRFYPPCPQCKKTTCTCPRGEAFGAWDRKSAKELWTVHIEKLANRYEIVRAETPGKFWLKDRQPGSELPPELRFKCGWWNDENPTPHQRE